MEKGNPVNELKTVDPETGEVISLLDQAATTLGHDLLQAMVDELKALQDPWAKTPAEKQDQAIDRLSWRIQSLIGRAVAIIAAGDLPVIAGHVESVTFKDGVKAIITTTKGESSHALADAEGGSCIIVITDAEQYLGRMEEIRGEADQRALIDEAA